MKVTPGGPPAVSMDVDYEWLGQNFVHDELVFALEFVEIWDSKAWNSEQMKGDESDGEVIRVGDIQIVMREKKVSDDDARDLSLVKF